MLGPYVHSIDPVLGEFGGLYLWWYGLSYTLGFLGIFLWLRRKQEVLVQTPADAYDGTLCIAVGVLLGGRFVEVVFYEWSYYVDHLWQVPALWLGGMATHGLLLGAILGTFVFYRWKRRSFLDLCDHLAIPGAWIMGVGRIGNFIDGQISGAVTDSRLGVLFPDLEGFRHPVVLYDAAKNLLLIPLLLWIGKRQPPRGVVFAHFIFWYAFLRLFVDQFREYRVETLGLGTGQILNLSMAAIGLGLWLVLRKTHPRQSQMTPSGDVVPSSTTGLLTRRLALISVLAFCAVIPSDWTQDIPKRYGSRHPGLEHSKLYPPIER